MNKQPWYARLSKVVSLIILIFVLIYIFVLRLRGDFTIQDAVFLLCILFVAAVFGNIESK